MGQVFSGHAITITLSGQPHTIIPGIHILYITICLQKEMGEMSSTLWFLNLTLMTAGGKLFLLAMHAVHTVHDDLDGMQNLSRNYKLRPVC